MQKGAKAGLGQLYFCPWWKHRHPSRESSPASHAHPPPGSKKNSSKSMVAMSLLSCLHGGGPQRSSSSATSVGVSSEDPDGLLGKESSASMARLKEGLCLHIHVLSPSASDLLRFSMPWAFLNLRR